MTISMSSRHSHFLSKDFLSPKPLLIIRNLSDSLSFYLFHGLSRIGITMRIKK